MQRGEDDNPVNSMYSCTKLELKTSYLEDVMKAQKHNTVFLTINGKAVRAIEGEKILWVALTNGIYIPNLCAIQGRSQPFASCRLCFIEIEGVDLPVTACATEVKDNMVINTRGEKALRLARTNLELLLANHPTDCSHCDRNGSCELQKIAHHLGVKLKSRRFRKVLRDLPLDTSSEVFVNNPNKCVLCGRCVWVCQMQLGINAIGFAYRGIRRVVTTFAGDPITQSGCTECGECVKVCPVGALVFKKH